jgi:hypothetical protein
MIRVLFISCFISIYSFCYGQTPAPEIPARFLARIPFVELTGGVMIVQAKLDELSQPFNFILDSGSGAISLDSATASEFNISHHPSGKTVNGIAGVSAVDHSPGNKLEFPDLTVDSLDFYINNYEVLSSVYGIKIDGIIGYSFLSRYIVKINYDSLFFEVFSPGKMDYPRNGYLLHPLFTSLPIENLTVKDARTIDANFYIDTGAGLCFLMSKRFVDDSGAIKKKRKPVVIQAQGLGGKKNMQLTVISGVDIGPYKFHRVPTNILDDEFNATSYPFVGGVIGNDIMRRFNTILNYRKREVYLKPNSHYNDEFDYSYTGLNMYYDEGKIILDEVIKKSPAYKAGLKKDDVVIAVNSNFSNDINNYKNIMQAPGERITLIISRKGVPRIISFRVGRIY